MERPRFCLSKWYLDVVSDAGEVFIGYHASLCWRRLKTSYAATLTGGNGEPRTRSTVRSEGGPILRMDSLSWASSALRVEGTWRAGTAQEISRTLYESPEGSVSWRCVLPAARCELVHGSRSLSGLGYAEHLSMTLQPWRLPIDTLRWGRFVSPEHSVVWIDWRENGSTSKTWIFLDGREAYGEVSEETVFFEGGRVDLPPSGRLALRSGRLSYLLRNFPRALRTSLPVGALAIHETKWRTRGCLHLDGARPAEGWAIHEVVRFGV